MLALRLHLGVLPGQQAVTNASFVRVWQLEGLVARLADTSDMH